MATSTRPERDANIGDLLTQARQLDATQIARVLAHQRQTGQRFGEAAVELELVAPDDVANALEKQFRYPTGDARSRSLLDGSLVAAHQPYSPQAEVYRSLRAQLGLRLRERALVESGTAIAVVSPQRGDGRSTVAANLAITCSQRGARTLLIDADLRRPVQHHLFGLAGTEGGGLAHMLSGRAGSLGVDAVPGLPSLFVLGSGAVPPNPMELLEGDALASLLADVRGKFDHVIVDTAAGSSGMDAAVVACACSAAVLVLQPGHSAMAPAQDLAAAMAAGGATLLGALFNRRH